MPSSADPLFLTDSRYRLFCRLFALASAIHLFLPDAWNRQWLPANLLYWTGLLAVAWRGSRWGFALCALGLALPLLFFQDQLTQSVLLLAFALVPLLPLSSSSEQRGADLALMIRGITLSAYALAALHKANTGFLDPTISCAGAGVAVLADTWDFPSLESAVLAPLWGPLFLICEGLFAAGLLFWPALAMLLGVALHIPLTIVFAPSFAFTMLSGWVMFLTHPDLHWLTQVGRRRLRFILILGSMAGWISFLLYARDHDQWFPFWSLKEASLWTLGILLLTAWMTKKPSSVFLRRGAWVEVSSPGGRWGAFLLVACLWMNGLTPYLGLQFHHSSAMLSNLRIDSECWNSLLFPESLRLSDPYIRVDFAAIGPPPQDPEVNAHFTSRLWNQESLAQEVTTWCDEGWAPLKMRGTFREKPFSVADLCRPRAWPFPQPHLPGFRAFQANLERTCFQECIH